MAANEAATSGDYDDLLVIMTPSVRLRSVRASASSDGGAYPWMRIRDALPGYGTTTGAVQ